MKPGWRMLPLRRLGSIVGGGTPSPDPAYWNGDVPFVTPPDLRPVVGGVVSVTERSLTAIGADIGSARVPANSVLLSIRAPIGYVAQTAAEVAFNQGCRALIPASSVEARFLVYGLMAMGPELAATGRGTTFTELSASQMASLVVHVPQLDEQRAIADFLDRETAQTDTLIAKQEQLIATLQERKLAAITSAVHGEAEPCQPTTSNWYPSLPVTWKLGRVKSVSRRVTDGAHISPDTDGGVYDFVSTRDLRRGQIDFSRALKTTPETYSYMVHTGCQPAVGDVLFSKDGTVGETAVITKAHDFVVASSLVIITPDPERLRPDFMAYVFASKSARDQADSMMRGAGLPRLSVGNLARLEMPIPRLQEQRAIVEALNASNLKIDTLIAKAEQLILLAKERRSALITAAVTGQIDVMKAA